MIAAKKTLACEFSGVIQMYSCKDGGQSSHTESLLTLHTGSRFLWSSLCMLPFVVPLRYRFHHWHCRHRRSRFSLSGNSSLSPLSSPSFALPALSSWLAFSKLRDCVQMCLERGQALCPGRTCGLGVFTLALFQAVSHTACWRLSLLDDNAQPSSHKRDILRLKWHQRSC